MSATARELFNESSHEVYFSTVSIWEAAIKYGLGRPEFPVAPAALRRNLLEVGYRELLITSEQVIAVAGMPLHHRDPFDRLLIAQAQTEGLILLTADAMLARYPGVNVCKAATIAL